MGCFTGFRNSVLINIQSDRADKAILFGEVHSIAERHNLKPDPAGTISGQKAGFFGVPYHYYFLKIDELDEDVTTVTFVHEGRMSHPKHAHTAPEVEFVDFIKNRFGSAIITMHQESDR